MELNEVEFVVEADSFAALALWSDYSSEARALGYGCEKYHTVEWVSESMGTSWHAGEIKIKRKSYPVVVEASFAKINGHNVMFWNACSRVVDYEMVQDSLKNRVPKAVLYCDAMNFGHVIQKVRNS